MAIAIIVGRDENETQRHEWFCGEWRQQLLTLDKNLDIRIWPHVGDVNDIETALVWRHPFGILKKFPNLKLIASLAAGVDHVLKDQELPAHIPIVRLTDPYMANDITQYVLASCLHYIKRFPTWEEKQKSSSWFRKPPFNYSDQTIGIMGVGYLGSKVASALTSIGLKVIGWRNSKKIIPNIKCFAGVAEFNTFLSSTNLLVCMLPLTSKTENILNMNTFSMLPKNSYLINLGRGEHLVEKDLLLALDTNQLSGACLDVFREEPLPGEHPFWQHPKIRVTPHIASVTNASTAAKQVLENYHRIFSGEKFLNQIDIQKEY